MTGPATSNVSKTIRRLTVCALVLMALIGICSTGASAASPSPSWSVFVHIEYPDGFVYEHAFATGVPTSDLPSILSACGRAHSGGPGVRYHCFPAPE